MSDTPLVPSPPDFSVRQCFAAAWARFQERPWFLMGIVILSWCSAFFFGYLTEDVYHQIEPTRSLLEIANSVIYYWVYFGLTVVALKLVDRVPATWSDVFVFDSRFVLYLLGNLLYGLIVGLGLVLFLVPGIYLALRYGFFWYAIIDGKQGVFDAFHESARITVGVKWQLILFALASMGVIFLGFLCFGVGIVAAVPIVLLASTHLYRVLLSQHPGTLSVAPALAPAAALSSDTSAAQG